MYICIYTHIYVIPGTSKSWRFVVSLGVGRFSCETRRNLTKILHPNYSKSAMAKTLAAQNYQLYSLSKTRQKVSPQKTSKTANPESRRLTSLKVGMFPVQFLLSAATLLSNAKCGPIRCTCWTLLGHAMKFLKETST